MSQGRQTHTTFCRICEALCGLEVDVVDGRIEEIRPDRSHVATEGFACVKGIKQSRIYSSPDRLTTPMKRVGDRFEPVTWKAALRDIGTRVRSIRKESGGDSIAMYVGTAAGFSILHPIFAQGFMTGLGSKSMYSSATQDCANKFATARHLYGFPFTQPFPDLDRTRCLIVVGANPAISKWSFLAVTNPVQRLKAIERRGGRVFVVDPRRTETAKTAGTHVFIRPNTDVFFYLSFLHEVLQRGAVDTTRVEAHMRGFEALEAVCADWPVERTAEVTGIAPTVFREMVDAYLEADGAALYSSTGVNMGSHGSLCFWLQEVLNAITGNLDRAGGTLVGKGIFDFAKFGKKNGTLLRDDRSRVGQFPSVNDGFPGGVLADEILTPGEGQVRALFVTGGNPLLTMPNSERLSKAFEKLDLLVTVDIFLNETGSLADYVLPATSPFQRPDLPFVFPLFLGMQSRPYLQATDPVLPPEGEQRDEATIYLDLARACGVGLFGSKALNAALQATRMFGQRGVPQRLVMDSILRVTRQPSFGKLRKHRHGLKQDITREGTFLGKRVVTDDGRVDLAPAPLLEELPRVSETWAREHERRDAYKLITKRAIRTHNSWTHNLEDFVKGDRETNYLYLHPEDASSLGLEAGELADVRTDTATVRLPVALNPDLMPKTVALPHGWGHQRAKGLGVASKTRGVNANLLAADGPDRLERVSGMAHLTGFFVEIEPARGPQAPTWSGLPER